LLCLRIRLRHIVTWLILRDGFPHTMVTFGLILSMNKYLSKKRTRGIRAFFL
jgi:hypothetical protein